MMLTATLISLASVILFIVNLCIYGEAKRLLDRSERTLALIRQIVLGEMNDDSERKGEQ